jgi:hypothetical protein
MPLVACPVASGAGALVVVPCDPARIDHRARAEWQLARVRHLFPEAPTALRPHYTVEQEGEMGFHLLLFRDLPATPFALVSFTDVDGRHLFAEVQVEETLKDVPPPASVAATLERVLAAAADPSTAVEAFAPLVVARGEDPARAWRAPADPTREDERAFAEEALEAVRRVAGSGGYEVVGFEIEYEDEGAWHVLLVRFDDTAEPVAFAFLPIGEAFLLGEVDG